MFLPPVVSHSTEALLARLTDSQSFLRVCAWCTPRVELERLNRTFPGAIIHTLCPACVRTLDTEVA